MLAKSRGFPFYLLVLALICLLGGFGQRVHAQGSEDTFFEDEDYFPDDDPFKQQDEFGVPKEDFAEGGDFIDESRLPANELTIGGRQSQLRLLGERELLPQNAAWGAGTGLLIGGWFALINQGTSRETQRSLGLGVVVGTLIGLAVGARSLITPNAPQPVGANDLNQSHDSAERNSQAFASSGRGTWSPFLLSWSFNF
jgi:hypothetical protein